MATEDISRRLVRPTQRYLGARMQQGRVLLDSDSREGDDERAELRRRTTADVVGCSGTPDCGFKLSYQRPFTVIDAGVMYAGGLRFELDVPRYLSAQPDLLATPELELVHRGEIGPQWQPTYPMLFYLEGFEAPVTPVEDRELFDPALGGVDTTLRVRRFARVLFDPRRPEENATCEALWARFRRSPACCPGARLEDDCSLTSPIRLFVGFVDDLETNEACERCEPEFRRGYRLAEAQAIRVMLTRDGRRFAWGLGAAAPLYRVKVVGKEVELSTAPRDDFLAPQVGQTVEILGWGALLPNGEKTAELVGVFTRVAKVEGPRKLVLEDDPTAEVTRVPPDQSGLYSAQERHALQRDTHLFMRVWQRGADRESPATSPIVAADGGTEHRIGYTGLTLRFELDEGAERGCSGDYWVIAARPEHPSLVVPWTLLDGERPHGPRRVYAPLGVARPAFAGLRDSGPRLVSLVFEDCRPRFESLTRQTGCCTVTAGPGCQYETLQAAVDALPSEGGRVCLVRGTLLGRAVIEGRRDIEIFGTGPRSVVTIDELAFGSEPVIDIRDCERVVLRDFTLTAPGAPGIRVIRSESNEAASATRLRNLSVHAETSPGDDPTGARTAVAIVNGAGDRVEGCELTMNGSALGHEPVVYVWGVEQIVARNQIVTTRGDAAIAWGGLQIDGGSNQVRIARNRIEGGLGHGITIGGVAVLEALPPDGVTVPADQRSPIGSVMLRMDDDGPVVSLVVSPVQDRVIFPTGSLREIELRDNVIVGMATSGIAAAGFFPPPPQIPRPLAIHVDRLEVVGNTIEGNLRRAPLYPELTTLGPSSVAAGGVALAEVSRTRIRDNLVRDNGVSRPEPVSGVFVLTGDLEISSNQIENNGRNLVEADTQAPILGVRAGLALPGIREPIDPDTGAPLSLPGARILDNVIRVREGKGIQLFTRANVAISGNEVLARGDNAPLDFPTTYRVRVRALQGEGTGAAVDIRVDGLTVDPDFPESGGTVAAGPFGAAVLFENNQITLDWPDKRNRPACASVIIAARESTVIFSRNQILTMTGRPFPTPRPGFGDFIADQTNNTPQLVVCPCIVEGFAVQLSDNRITEGYFEVAISAITRSLGLGNVTAQNAATHCVMALPGSSINFLNDELVNVESGQEPERFCDSLGAQVVDGALTIFNID